MKIYQFTSEIKRFDLQNAGFIEFPFDVEQEFGVKSRVKVKAKIDGVEYRGSLVKMGYNCHLLGITQEIRKRINKNIGDTVYIELQKDEEERIVEIPKDFQLILDKSDAIKNFFNSLSYTHRKEYVRWIESAKKEETRAERIQKSKIFLENNIKTPDGVKKKI